MYEVLNGAHTTPRQHSSARPGTANHSRGDPSIATRPRPVSSRPRRSAVGPAQGHTAHSTRSNTPSSPISPFEEKQPEMSKQQVGSQIQGQQRLIPPPDSAESRVVGTEPSVVHCKGSTRAAAVARRQLGPVWCGGPPKCVVYTAGWSQRRPSCDQRHTVS